MAIGAVAAGLMFEITITRLFSLFFQYHYAYLALSLAVLGISLGAALAYFVPPPASTNPLRRPALAHGAGAAPGRGRIDHAAAEHAATQRPGGHDAFYGGRPL
ncbi:MAG: hypothetical protein R2911_39970 [Caldilineaceae bacterium]